MINGEYSEIIVRILNFFRFFGKFFRNDCSGFGKVPEMNDLGHKMNTRLVRSAKRTEHGLAALWRGVGVAEPWRSGGRGRGGVCVCDDCSAVRRGVCGESCGGCVRGGFGVGAVFGAENPTPHGTGLCRGDRKRVRRGWHRRRPERRSPGVPMPAVSPRGPAACVSGTPP